MSAGAALSVGTRRSCRCCPSAQPPWLSAWAAGAEGRSGLVTKQPAWGPRPGHHVGDMLPVSDGFVCATRPRAGPTRGAGCLKVSVRHQKGPPAGPQVALPRFLIEADVSNGTGASHIGNARASAVPALRTRGFAAGASRLGRRQAPVPGPGAPSGPSRIPACGPRGRMRILTTASSTTPSDDPFTSSQRRELRDRKPGRISAPTITSTCERPACQGVDRGQTAR